MSQMFESFLESKGIHHELAVPYSPEHNGVAKRMSRTPLESAQSMMVHASLTNKFETKPWNVHPTSGITLQRLLSRETRHPLNSGV